MSTAKKAAASKALEGKMSETKTAQAETRAAASTGFKRKAALVVPTISMKNMKKGDSLIFRAEAEIVTKADIDPITREQKKNKQGEPAEIHILRITDHATGELGEIVLGVIAANALQECGSIVGRVFEMIKGDSESNKATKWQVFELEAE